MNGKSWIVTVIAALAFVAGIVLYIGDLRSRITALEGKHLRPDPWTGKDALFWSVQLKEANPQLKMPIPKHQSDE